MVILSSISDDDLNYVSGGMPNPSRFKMSFDEVPEDKKNDRYFMHWWRIFGGVFSMIRLPIKIERKS